MSDPYIEIQDEFDRLYARAEQLGRKHIRAMLMELGERFPRHTFTAADGHNAMTVHCDPPLKVCRSWPNEPFWAGDYPGVVDHEAMKRFGIYDAFEAIRSKHMDVPIMLLELFPRIEFGVVTLDDFQVKPTEATQS